MLVMGTSKGGGGKEGYLRAAKPIASSVMPLGKTGGAMLIDGDG